jgi:hypothetical protein
VVVALTAPLIATLLPDSLHVPAKVNAEANATLIVLPAAGEVMASVGATVSFVNTRVAELEFPASSVCESVKLTVPSATLDRSRVALIVPLIQSAEVDSAPETLTLSPASQLASMANAAASLAFIAVPASGKFQVNEGAMLSFE